MSGGDLQPTRKGSNTERKHWKMQALTSFSNDREDHALWPGKLYTKYDLPGNLLIHK